MNNSKSSKSFLIYLSLWILYLGQGAIWGEGSNISQTILMVLLGWSLLLSCKCINLGSRIPRSLRIFAILLLSYLIYGLYSMAIGETLYVAHSGAEIKPFAYIKQALISILPAYAFYYYCIKYKITLKILCFIAIIFFILIIVNFFANQARMLQMAIEMRSSATEFTNNSSYGFIYIVPYLYLFKNKRIAIALLVGVILMLLSGMKRGAIMIGAIAILIYLNDFFKYVPNKTKTLWILAFIVLCVIVGKFCVDLYETSPFFKNRVEQTLEGYVSRRDVIVDSLLSYYWNEASILHQIFGSGANATLKHAENFAHNDWLEMLINQGIVGVILQWTFFIVLWSEVKRMKKYNKLYFQSFRTLFIVVFIKTFFSMSICLMRPYITLLIGFFLARLTDYCHLKYEDKLSSDINYHTSLQR